jgi:hypothetical protein
MLKKQQLRAAACTTAAAAYSWAKSQKSAKKEIHGYTLCLQQFDKFSI